MNLDVPICSQNSTDFYINIRYTELIFVKSISIFYIVYLQKISVCPFTQQVPCQLLIYCRCRFFCTLGRNVHNLRICSTGRLPWNS